MARTAASKEPAPRTASFTWRGGAVDRDLDVDVVHGRESPRPRRVDPGAVGRELDPHASIDGVLEELEEVPSDRRLATAHVHVEDLHRGELVDEGHRLGGRQLVRVASARRAQAVHAGEVARPCELPREADGSGRARARSGRGATRQRPSTTPEACRRASAATSRRPRPAPRALRPRRARSWYASRSLEDAARARRLHEDEASRPVVVRERAERLRSQRRLVGQPAGRTGRTISWPCPRGERHGLSRRRRARRSRPPR